jgi:hypothetical protein
MSCPDHDHFPRYSTHLEVRDPVTGDADVQITGTVDA